MTKIIIDTDMLIDDWMAILYLLNHKNIEVVGISVTGTGGCYLESGSRNALALLKILEVDYKIPVVSGAKQPLVYSNIYPKKIRDHAKDFMGIKIPKSDAKLYDKSVEDFYADIIEATVGGVTILNIGGGTNFGRFVQSKKFNESIRSKIANLVIMGGAINVPGNLADLTDNYSFNQLAEWNVFIDVKAMENIFNSNLPIVLVPLDACQQVIFDHTFVDEFKAKTSGIVAKYVAQMLEKYFSGSVAYPIFDPLAACILSNLNTPNIGRLIKQETLMLSINQNMIVSGDADSSGQTKKDPSGKKINVCMDVNKERFAELFISSFSN
ncbi:MAG: nucleoside hydrolase [Sedimenticola sp.]